MPFTRLPTVVEEEEEESADSDSCSEMQVPRGVFGTEALEQMQENFYQVCKRSTKAVVKEAYQLGWRTRGEELSHKIEKIRRQKEEACQEARRCLWEKNEACMRARVAEQRLRQEEREKEQRAEELGRLRADGAASLAGMRWEYQGNKGNWLPFHSDHSRKMTGAFSSHQPTCTVVLDDFEYEIDFGRMLQTNCVTGKERQIRSTCGCPPHWLMSEKDIMRQFQGIGHGLTFETLTRRITAPAKLAMFSELLNDASFHYRDRGGAGAWGCPCENAKYKFQVCELYHVENLHLLEGYQSCCQLLQKKHMQRGVTPQAISPDVGKGLRELGGELGIEADNAMNERLLIHGTTYDTARSIVVEGFDFRVAKERGLYGKGTYFTTQSCKSHQYSTGKRTHIVVLARVALGNPFYTEQTEQGMVRPPTEQEAVGSNGPRYDSVIARPGWMAGHPAGYQTHMEFVIFEHLQAYPEYVLRYKATQ